jgi:hypothetical protein
VLEEGLAGEVLEVRVLHPAGEHGFVGKAVGVLQVQQPCHQTWVGSGPPLVRGEEAGPFPLEPGPVDQHRQPDRFMPPIDHVGQPRAQQIGLFRWAWAVLHVHQNRRIAARCQWNPAIP